MGAALTVDVVLLLSPQLLKWAMQPANAWDCTQQWLQGFFGPIEFMITDPLGRRPNTFPAGSARPADLDGSGIIEQADLDLLKKTRRVPTTSTTRRARTAWPPRPRPSPATGGGPPGA